MITNETKMNSKQLLLALKFAEWCEHYQSNPVASCMGDFRDFLADAEFNKILNRADYSESDCVAAHSYFVTFSR